MALGKSLENILGNYFGENAVNLGPNVATSTQKITDKIDTKIKTKNSQDFLKEISKKTTPIKKKKVVKTPKSKTASVKNENLVNVEIKTIAIDLIGKNPFQTRTYFDESKIYSLAENIKENGLIQPIVVVKKTDDSLYLLAGERRLRACKLIGWKSILCLIKNEEDMENSHPSLISAMENLQREDLSPIELGNTFRMLIKTQETNEAEIARLIDKSSQYVRNYLRLLTLHPKVQDMLNMKLLTEGQARPLVGLDPESQLNIATVIKQKDLTVKETLRLIDNLMNPNSDIPLKVRGHNLPSEFVNDSLNFSKKIPNSKLKYFGNEKKGKIVVYWG